jgi:omega-amidase
MKNLNITIIQTSLFWEDSEKNIKHFDQLLSSQAGKTDLIVLPEMFNTGFSMNSAKLAQQMNGDVIKWMQKKSAELNCCITGSSIIKENDNYYNRLIWMQPDGVFYTYDKRHLFRMAQEHNYYSPGTQKILPEIKGWKICPLICYDLRFPVWSRNGMGENRYDLLIYIANWPEARRNAWSSLLIARAIENQCYVAGVNRIGSDGKGISYSGDSAVIDPKGNVISQTKPFEEKAETIELNKRELEDFREKFPVESDADNFNIEI